jgi:hypothetical protein
MHKILQINHMKPDKTYRVRLVQKTKNYFLFNSTTKTNSPIRDHERDYRTFREDFQIERFVPSEPIPAMAFCADFNNTMGIFPQCAVARLTITKE